MSENKPTTRIFDNFLPEIFNARQNKNWKGLIEAIGNSDEYVSQLIQQVKDQIFIKTADGVFLDRLGSNVNVLRPKGVGMRDLEFKKYIPIMSFMPKQVQSTINELIRLYFSEENSMAYVQSLAAEPYTLSDGQSLIYIVDGNREEQIVFNSDDFQDINNATAEEISSIINRRVKYSFSSVYYDNFNKKKYIRIFTQTIGNNGFIEITGGTSNIFLQFEGFDSRIGNGIDTQWEIYKVGNTMRFQYTGNEDPRIDLIEIGDVILSLIPDNEGSFVVNNIDLSTQSIYFTNYFGYVPPSGHYTYTQSSSNEFKILKPYRSNVYKRLSKALLWEVKPNHFYIEIPTMPSIPKKKLQGGCHFNGLYGTVKSIVSPTELEMDEPLDEWENSGFFTMEYIIKYPNQYITELGEIAEDPIYSITKRSFKDTIYSYNGITGNILQNINPNLPEEYIATNYTITAGERISNYVTLTIGAHTLQAGDNVNVYGTTSMDGQFTIDSVGATTISYSQVGIDDTTTTGILLYEKPGFYGLGSVVYQYYATTKNKVYPGTYVRDPKQSYIIRSESETTVEKIKIGQKKKIIKVSGTGNMPNQNGYFIIDFGTQNQEGPIEYYYYNTTDNTMVIDSTYSFKNPHDIGCIINLCENKPIDMTKQKYSPYVTDPAIAINAFKEAVYKLKSAGINSEIIINYPKQFYAGYDVYEE